ncbi:uncharacterized protein LOC128564011 [Nycticebus coucang]|uniref:uncharacterized protein LOC128564011 n=1 Tax=Nycticebus coucang TaxID=9470 RepID=UPI00234D736C|nr:uncharacterized protein LOC128564011 [Nycticebus coucang]
MRGKWEKAEGSLRLRPHHTQVQPYRQLYREEAIHWICPENRRGAASTSQEKGTYPVPRSRARNQEGKANRMSTHRVPAILGQPPRNCPHRPHPAHDGGNASGTKCLSCGSAAVSTSAAPGTGTVGVSHLLDSDCVQKSSPEQASFTLGGAWSLSNKEIPLKLVQFGEEEEKRGGEWSRRTCLCLLEPGPVCPMLQVTTWI